MPIILNIPPSSWVRDIRLWGLACFLNATWDLDPDTLTGHTNMSTKEQLKGARKLFTTIVSTVDQPRTVQDCPIAPGTSRQIAIYNFELEHHYRLTGSAYLTEKVRKVHVDPAACLLAIRRYSKLPRVSKHHLYTYLRISLDGFHIKRARYTELQDMRCCICKPPGTIQRVAHFVGFGTPQCVPIRQAADRAGFEFRDIALTGNTTDDAKLIWFASAVHKSFLDFRNLSMPDTNLILPM